MRQIIELELEDMRRLKDGDTLHIVLQGGVSVALVYNHNYRRKQSETPATPPVAGVDRQCSYCDHLSTTTIGLYQHVRAQHREEFDKARKARGRKVKEESSQVVCPDCGGQYKNKASLSVHKSTQHRKEKK